MVSSRLLMGTGNLSYEDVTVESNINCKDWVNGISIIDLNHDGLKDIYLSVGGPDCSQSNCRNKLFINQSTNNKIKFIESAASYNLDIPLYSQQSVFIDLDLDGDLDMYQLQNYVDPQTKNYPKPKNYFSPKSQDKLFLNLEAETGQIQFSEVSEKWGISHKGFGLGISVSDFNQDGYPDLYIANDFISDDQILINQNGKAFLDESKKYLKHTSYNSMGVDIGDINNDQLQDIIVVDMLPFQNQRQKTMLGSMNYDKFLLAKKENYNDQFIRNTVQLNTGSNQSFRDVAPFYNMHETDWSWSPIICDFDNDGDNDVYISNGYGKNITDLDFVNYNSNLVGFGDKSKLEEQIKKDINALPDVKLPNHLFINEGEEFQKINSLKKNITNGVAYADLDNDGDFELIQNNLNEKSNILINQSENNFLKVRLQQAGYNKDAIGSSVLVESQSGKIIKKEFYPVRSYLSTMDDELIFGLGKDSVKQIVITWPDQTQTLIDTTLHNCSIVIDKNERSTLNIKNLISSVRERDTILLKETKIKSVHDFSIQNLLFKSCSNENVKLASNKENDGFYIANLKDQLLYFNATNENINSLINLDGALVDDIIEIERNQNKYLLVALQRKQISKLGLYEQIDSEWKLNNELILAEGHYQFARDGNQIYVTSFPKANQYPKGNTNWIHKISITNNTILLEPLKNMHLKEPCITDIEFVNLDDDIENELVVVGEWLSPTIFDKKGDDYEICKINLLDSLKGFWQSINACDIDNDGDQDLVLGNLGTNTRLKTSYSNPLQINKNDLDNNGQVDPLMSLPDLTQGSAYTYSSRDDITKKLPSLKQLYSDYDKFSKATYDDVISMFQNQAELLEINCLESIILENIGNCEFKKRKLPETVQHSIVNDIYVEDLGQDNLPDLLFLTNNEEVEIHNGNIDGLNSLWVTNNGHLEFKSLPSVASGLYIPEPAENIIKTKNDKYYISTSNGVFKIEMK